MENKEINVHLKGGFSERNGIKKFSDLVQIDTLNTRTRNKIAMAIRDFISCFRENFDKCEIIRYLYLDVFSVDINKIPIKSAEEINNTNFAKILNEIDNIILTLKYEDIFDVIEAIVKFEDYCVYLVEETISMKDMFIDDINKIFYDENVNFRITNNLITDIVNNEAITEMESTLNNPYDVVKKHYGNAIKNLYKDKDYSNSIKESISSVEAMCQIINDSKEPLGKALEKLKIEIHPALKKAYISIYGYTSDANGARHANGIGEKDATFSEAKYMLISCSAFVNYLEENFEQEV